MSETFEALREQAKEAAKFFFRFGSVGKTVEELLATPASEFQLNCAVDQATRAGYGTAAKLNAGILREFWRHIQDEAELEKITQELKGLKEDAAYTSEDLEQVIQDRTLLQGRKLELENKQKLGLIKERTAAERLGIHQWTAIRMKQVQKYLDQPVSVKEPEEVLKGKVRFGDLINALEIVAGSVNEYFQFKDLFKVVDWCLNGDYDLMTALRAAAQDRIQYAYILRDFIETEDGFPDGECKVHGVFLNQELATHYYNELSKSGREVELIRSKIVDHKKPVEMTVWELDFRNGKATPKSSFWTLDPEAMTLDPQYVKEIPKGARTFIDFVEKRRAVYPKDEPTRAHKLADEVRKAHKRAKLKWILDPNNTNFYELKDDPDC